MKKKLHYLLTIFLTCLFSLPAMADKGEEPNLNSNFSTNKSLNKSNVNPVTIIGITTLSPNPNNGKAGTVIYKVEFSEIVNGVTAANFLVTRTGGVIGVSITNVVQNPILKTLWQVTVILGPVAFDGAVHLSMVNVNGLYIASLLPVLVFNPLPFVGETYTVLPEIIATTLPVTDIFTNGATLQGSVKSAIEDVTVGFDDGSTSSLTDAVHVVATTNGTVTAGSGSNIAKFTTTQSKPGYHYYRITTKSTSGNIVNGFVVNYYIPYKLKNIKAISNNPNNGKTGRLVFELEFNGIVNNLTSSNLAVVTTGNAGSSSILTVIKSNDPLKPNTWLVLVTLLGQWGDGTLAVALNNTTGLSVGLANALPYLDEVYTISSEMNVETLNVTNLTLNGSILQGTVRSDVEDLTVGFDYGDSPALTDAIHVAATVNAIVTTGSGAKISQYSISQDKPGNHYYRVTATGANGNITYGKILNYNIPYTVKTIKALSANPNNGKTGPLVFEVEFNSLESNLNAANFSLVTNGNAGSGSILTVVQSNDPLKPNSWFVLVTLLGQWGDGTLALALDNSNGLLPVISINIPYIGQTYTISTDINIETLQAALHQQGFALQGSVRSNLETMKTGFDYGTSPSLIGATHVAATTNAVVAAGSGATPVQYIIPYEMAQGGANYYRVTAKDIGSNIIYGKILKFYGSYSLKGIKAISANPNNGKIAMIYEVEFNGLIANLTTSNLDLIKTGNIGTATIASVVKSSNPLKPNSWFVTVTLGDGGQGTIALRLNNMNGLSQVISNTLPFIGEVYTISTDINVETTGTILYQQGVSLEGSVSSDLENLKVSFDYGTSPSLIGAKHIAASTNAVVVAGSGAKMAQYIVPFQTTPAGAYYYRVTAKGTNNNMIYGKILGFDMPYMIKAIKTSSSNPINGKNGLIYEIEFNGVMNNLKASNLDIIKTGDIGTVDFSEVVQSGDPLRPNSWFIYLTLGAGGEGTVTLRLNNADGLPHGLFNALPFAGEIYTILPEIFVVAPSPNNVTMELNPIKSNSAVVNSYTLKTNNEFKLEANNMLTPNGDGKNDFLVIKDLEQFPAGKLTIVDHNGKTLYKTNHYLNDWNGMINGVALAKNTYYYTIDFGKRYGIFKGFVTLIP